MIIYLHDKRRQAAQWLPKIQHVLGGVPLLLSGLSKLADQAERPMALVEIAVAAVVLAAFVKELRAEIRAVRNHAHEGAAAPHSAFGWFDLAAGGLLIFEAFHGAHHKPGYLRPQFLSGVITIGIGLFHARLHTFHRGRRYVRFDEAGLEFRRGLFRRLAIPWKDLASVDLGGPTAVFHRTNGKSHKVRLNLLHNSAAVRQAIADHASEAGVRTESSAARA